MAIAELVVKLIGDVSGFQKSMTQVGKDLTRTGKAISSAGSTLTKGLTLPLAGIAGASLAMAADFQSSMSKVSALGDITGADLKNLEKQAIELGAKTQFSAKEAAEGMGEFAAAGFSASQISDAMAGTLDLAAAAQISVGDAARITSTSLGQFHLQASDAGKVADVMAKGAASGNLSILDLSESLKYVGPVAYATGRSLEETTAAITMLSNAGILGSQAGTALRMGMIRFVKPTKQAQEVINELNLSLTDGAGKIKPLTDIIGQLSNKHANLAQVTKLVGVEAATAWQALVDKGAPALQELQGKIENSNGAAATMAATLRDNLKGSYEQMTGAVNTLGISIGMALTPAAKALMGAIQKLAEQAVGMVEGFRGLSTSAQNAILAFVGIVAIGGPTALAIGGIITAIGGFIKMIGTAQSLLVVFTSATGIGLIVIAIGAAVAAFVYFKDDILKALNVAYGYVEKFVDGISTVFKRIGEILQISGFYDVMDAIGEGFSAAFDTVIDWLDTFVDDFQNGLSVIGDYVDRFVDSVFDQKFYDGLNVINGYLDTFMGWFDSLFDYLTGLVTRFIDESFIADFKRGINVVTGYVNNFVSDFKVGWNFIIKGQDGVKKSFDESAEKIKDNAQAIQDNTKKSKENNNAKDDAVKTLKPLVKETKDHTEETEKNNDSTDRGSKSTKALKDEKKALEKAEREAKKATEEHAKELDNLVTSSDKYKDVLEKIRDNTIPAQQKGQMLSDLYKEADERLRTYNEANDQYQQILQTMAQGGNVPAEMLAEVIAKLDEAKGKLDEFKGDVGGLGKGKKGDKKDSGGFIGDMLKDVFDIDLADSIGADFANILSDTLTNALSLAMEGGTSEDWAKVIGKGVGDSLAAAADSYLPGSGSVVKLFEPLITEGLTSLFGSDSASTKARKAADKFFADTFESNRLAIIVKGRLVEIRDLVFQGNSLFGGTVNFSDVDGAFSSFLESLPDDARESFGGVGLAFEELLGVGEDISGQLAAVFANNVGGSLNNLQLLVQATGKTFEEMNDVVVEAFLDGKVSALEAQTALNGIARIAQKGIPDGVGFTVQAFENLKAAGTKGGRASIDALQDLAYEAKELGITTIPQLMANLQKSGKFTTDEIQQVFNALSKQGIDSIDKLTNATNNQLIAALADLEGTKFPFQDGVEDAKDLAEEINKIPKMKDITFNIKTNFDGNTKEAIKAGYVPSAPGATVQTPKPSARGNVFSAGAIMPFAKGGVVSDFTMFDIGSMAERGPEAIMPLERLPDGRLGVLSATSNNSDATVVNHITINAPYAQPGAAEAIRREIDKYFDTKNRFPGIRR